jgi:hypothetical protein
MIVDSSKLERVREIVDASIAEQAIVEGVSRRAATAGLIDEMGYRLRCVKVERRWIAYVVPRGAWVRASELAIEGQCIRAAGTELFERLPWHYESENLDEAMTAVMCRLLDSGVNLAKTVPHIPGTGGFEAVNDAAETPMSRWFVRVREQWSAVHADSAATAMDDAIDSRGRMPA